MSEGKRTVSPEAVEEVVGRIVRVADPERIIMFGSAARGRMGRNSDVDLLVVKSAANRLELAQRIYANLHGVGEAVDVIVVTPEDVERYREERAVVIAPALEEGEVIYNGRIPTENTESPEGKPTNGRK